ncbi:MAG: hypothetical protein J3K34DRAFT_409334 [Monoraphidium minutum]|nr:MAG: hypothetical protein J3K34DRAFT_409334 [Monoraphidium minutum]
MVQAAAARAGAARGRAAPRQEPAGRRHMGIPVERQAETQMEGEQASVQGRGRQARGARPKLELCGKGGPGRRPGRTPTRHGARRRRARAKGGAPTLQKGKGKRPCQRPRATRAPRAGCRGAKTLRCLSTLPRVDGRRQRAAQGGTTGRGPAAQARGRRRGRVHPRM